MEQNGTVVAFDAGFPIESEPERGRQVSEGAERAGRRERVARDPQDPRGAGGTSDELVDERGLADAGFAADEDDASVTRGRLRQVGREPRQVGLALEQLHDRRLLGPSHVYGR